jgi:hypothetical protein
LVSMSHNAVTRDGFRIANDEPKKGMRIQ